MELVNKNWEALYRSAMLEHDRTEFLPKAVAAEQAITENLHQFAASTDESEEKRVLTEALNNLRVLLLQEAAIDPAAFAPPR